MAELMAEHDDAALQGAGRNREASPQPAVKLVVPGERSGRSVAGAEAMAASRPAHWPGMIARFEPADRVEPEGRVLLGCAVVIPDWREGTNTA